MSINVNEMSEQVKEMIPLFDIVDDLASGTLRMRERKGRYLPRFPLETKEIYDFRLKRSVLLPAYTETLKSLVGKIFARPITLKESVPDAIRDILGSIDAEDRSFNALAMEATKMAIHYGISYLLVDTAPAAGDTLADGRANPYITLISPRNVLGWLKDTAGNLTQVRIADTIEEDDGKYGVKTKDIVTVLYPDRFEKFKDDGAGWTIFEEGKFTLGKVPLVPIYAKRTGFMTAEPTLLELAHLVIKHWQEWSDQSNILRVARVPLLAGIGLEAGDTQEISAQKMIYIPKDGDLKWVEHTGAAISAGQEDLNKLVELMRLSGARMTYVQNTVKTATQANEEASDNKSALAVIAENVRDSFNIALDLMGEWLSLGDDAGGEVDLNTDIDNDNTPVESMGVISKMVANGSLSTQTEFEEAKRRGLIDESLVWEDEQARINNDNAGFENQV